MNYEVIWSRQRSPIRYVVKSHVTKEEHESDYKANTSHKATFELDEHNFFVDHKDIPEVQTPSMFYSHKPQGFFMPQASLDSFTF